MCLLRDATYTLDRLAFAILDAGFIDVALHSVTQCDCMAYAMADLCLCFVWNRVESQLDAGHRLSTNW